MLLLSFCLYKEREENAECATALIKKTKNNVRGTRRFTNHKNGGRKEEHRVENGKKKVGQANVHIVLEFLLRARARAHFSSPFFSSKKWIWILQNFKMCWNNNDNMEKYYFYFTIYVRIYRHFLYIFRWHVLMIYK